MPIAKAANCPVSQLSSSRYQNLRYQNAFYLILLLSFFSPPGNATSSAELRQTLVPVISQTVCSQPDYYADRLTDNMLCAGYAAGGNDACLGDSGGPLVCRSRDQWVLVGIVSFGDSCAKPQKPGIYSRVTRYLDWIWQNTRGEY